MKKLLYLFVLSLVIYSCSNKMQVSSIQPSSIPLNSSSPEDENIKSLIEPYKSVLDNEMNEVLIISTAEAVKGQPESSLGNLIADITLIEANNILQKKNLPLADICMLNNGGLRTSLPEGKITVGKIFELMPFENEMVVLTLSGEKALGLLNYVAKSNGQPLAGATLNIIDEKPENIFIGGKTFDASKTYRIVTSDYLAGGGDKMRFFSEPLSYQILNVKLRDAIINFMRAENKKGNTLNPKTDGRIKSN
ncbi:MAG TPA: 5'-nucleotidase C-terminal domain-containing protein [Bacteroidia bacterium]|nr:5'-nucleotidase C-terminal domain-containing protein [Bacteroidia bacterium]